jgi:AcrR family transcriptional regulator
MYRHRQGYPFRSARKKPKGEKSRGERSRLNILHASARLFALRGYDCVSIRDVAAEVGQVPSLIIHYFGTKALLYREMVGYYLGDGAVFMRALAPVWHVDPADKQAAANAIAESIHIFYENLYGSRRVKYLDRLILQVIFGHGSVDAPLALEWIRPFERIFENFFVRVCGLSESDAGIRMEIFFSHVFYPAVCRGLLFSEHSWKEYPEDFLTAWKCRVAKDFCLGLGLPAPEFDHLSRPAPVYCPAAADCLESSSFPDVSVALGGCCPGGAPFVAPKEVSDPVGGGIWPPADAAAGKDADKEVTPP